MRKWSVSRSGPSRWFNRQKVVFSNKVMWFSDTAIFWNYSTRFLSFEVFLSFFYDFLQSPAFLQNRMMKIRFCQAVTILMLKTFWNPNKMKIFMLHMKRFEKLVIKQFLEYQTVFEISAIPAGNIRISRHHFLLVKMNCWFSEISNG